MKGGVKVLNLMNNHPISMAIAMLVLNVGSKHVDFNFTSGQSEMVASLVTREVFLCAVFFSATKNLLLSALLTLVVSILLCFVLNEKSSWCMLPSISTSPSRQHFGNNVYLSSV